MFLKSALAKSILNKGAFGGDGGNRTRVREADHRKSHRLLRSIESRLRAAQATKLSKASRRGLALCCSCLVLNALNHSLQ
jgi:hypothetical protein